MRKVKKNLKGMTLYEMIISIAVFALMAVVLIAVGTHVDRTTRAANNLKSKMVAEAPFAANKISKNSDDTDRFDSEEIHMTFTMDREAKWYDKATDTNKTDPHASCTLDLQKYNTEAAFTGDRSVHVDPNEVNSGLNLQFVDILPPPPAGP